MTDDNALFDYYKQIGTATDLPLFVQSQPFPMSMDLIVRMYKEIPSFRQIKDEAGDTLARITEIRTRTNDGVKVFTGNGVRNMITELMLGAQGFCPTVDLADIYAQAADLWYAGKHSEAFDMFGRVLCFGTISETVGAPGKYVLVARGVFKNTRSRRGAMAAGLPARTPREQPPRQRVVEKRPAGRWWRRWPPRPHQAIRRRRREDHPGRAGTAKALHAGVGVNRRDRQFSGSVCPTL